MTTTLTLKVPREMAAKLEAVAARKRVPKSKLMREALGTYLSKQKVEPSMYDLMKDAIGCFDSGVTDLATNPKHMEGFGKWRS
jgi:predicted DNA-binding protein